MLSFIKSTNPVSRKLILYSENPSLKDGFLNEYMQASGTQTVFGFKRYPKYTKLIDISDDLFKNAFSKTTLYEIRRANQDNLLFGTSDDVNSFVVYYNKFLDEKKLPGSLSSADVNKYGSAFIIRFAKLPESQLAVYHTYLYDNSTKRVRLLHSVSDIHDQSITPDQKAVLSRANRVLHYEDMLYFKEKGCLTYDFGGYAFNTKDKSLAGINSFKDNFGGVLIEESNYEPYVFYTLKKLLKIFRKQMKK